MKWDQSRYVNAEHKIEAFAEIEPGVTVVIFAKTPELMAKTQAIFDPKPVTPTKK